MTKMAKIVERVTSERENVNRGLLVRHAFRIHPEETRVSVRFPQSKEERRVKEV